MIDRTPFPYIYAVVIAWSRCRCLDIIPGGVIKPIFSVPLFPHFFQNNQDIGYLYDKTFAFDRCHRSWAAKTPVKHERHLKYLNQIFP